MFTRCPHCETCFRITTEQLRAAHGAARCGRCFGTFNSLDQLVEETADNFHNNQSGGIPPIDTTHPQTTTDAPVNPFDAPEESTPSSRHFFAWLLTALLLCAALITQYAYFNLNHLSQQVQLRPALTLLCKLAPCELPLMRSPHLIKLIDRDIRIHPTLINTLQVKAEIVNSAIYTQQFPLLELSLQDITGYTLASRRFKPKEYAKDKTEISQGLAPGQSIQILLELVDPGEEAVGFEFEFL